MKTSLILLYFAASRGQDVVTDRRYDYPYYQDISPCPCDLQPGCDTYCCCDPVCPEEMKINHTCFQGLFGGEKLDKGVELNCSDPRNLYMNPSFHFLCVYWENSPYLGHFYEHTSSLNNLGEYEAVAVRVKKYIDPAVERVEEDVDGYREGQVVRTLYSRNEGITGELSIPQPSLDGSCTSGPVRFLRDQRSSCFRKLSSDICQDGKNSEFDHQMYLMQFPGIEFEPTFAQVLTTSNSLTNTSLTEVKYFTTLTPEVYVSDAENVLDTPDSEVDDVDRLLSSSLTDSVNVEDLFMDKVWKQGVEEYEKLPYFANYEASERECRNIVLEVKYTLYWTGNKVERVNVAVLLGNISLGRSDNVYFNQYFSVTFIHAGAENQSEMSSSNLLERSGNPGYLIGYPLISLYTDQEEGGENATYSMDHLGIRIWGAETSSSLCRDSSLRKVEFGLDTFSGCYIRLMKQNLSDCQVLSQRILDVQKSLVTADYLAKDGSLNYTSSDAVPILFEEVNPPDSKQSLSSSCQVASSLTISILYTNSEMNGQATRVINGVRVRPDFETWQWTCIRDESGSCKSINQYLLKTRVEFIEIPLIWHLANYSRFWVIQDSLSCEGDVCWQDILQPIQHSFRIGENELAVILEWTVLIGLLLLPSYQFSRMKL